MRNVLLDQFLETALWSTLDYDRPDGEDSNLDDKYCLDDISDSLKAEAEVMIDNFMIAAMPLFTDAELDDSPIGHDLWLTVEGHGAGFWDGDYEKGDALTDLCAQYGRSWGDKLNEAIERGSDETY